VYLQNNMNYSSLAILSRCPQAPVPNLGQYDHQSVRPSSPPSTPDDGQDSLPPSADPRLAGDLTLPAVSLADVHSASQRSTDLHGVSASIPPPSGNYVPVAGVSAEAMSSRGASTDTTDWSSTRVLASAGNDDFDDFKSASTSSAPRSVPLSHSLSATLTHDSIPG